MDYETVISEKFPKCNVEVLERDVFEPQQLAEYITDDITVYDPHMIIIYRHLIRFFVNVGCRGKIYYLENFTDDDLSEIYEKIGKLTRKMDVKITVLPESDPDRELLDVKNE